MPIIESKNLSWKYEGAKTLALDNISFSVEKGEFVAVMGKTGAGKSTLCKCINGLIPMRSRGTIDGEVFVKNKPVSQTDFYEITSSVGMVFQDPEMQFVMLTAEDEIALGLENARLDPSNMRNRIEKVSRYVGLKEEHLNKSSMDLSGGEKQKVAISAMLALEPEILVLDEPTSDLDPIGRKEIYKVLNTLREEKGITILLVTHESTKVAECADRLIILESGRIIENGSPRELFKDARRMESLGIKVPSYMELFSNKKEEPPLHYEEALDLLKKTPCKILIQTPSIPKKTNEAIIEVKDLRYTYQDGTEALGEINLKIFEGDYIALIGSNGSGKTTLAKNIKGLFKPTSGSVSLYGVDTLNLDMKIISQKVGYCFQNPDHQLFCQTTRDEIAFGPINLGFKENKVKEIVSEIIKTIGLEEFSGEHPFFLGKGQRQRLSVASVLAMEPKIIIVDEPTTGQDYLMCEELMAIFDRLNKEGHTIIIITHDMELAAGHCKSVVVMNQGKIIKTGQTREVFSDIETLQKANIQPPQITSLSLELFGKSQPPALKIEEILI